MKRHQDGADGRGSGSQRLSSPVHQGWVHIYVRGKSSCVWQSSKGQREPHLDRNVLGVDTGWWPWQPEPAWGWGVFQDVGADG